MQNRTKLYVSLTAVVMVIVLAVSACNTAPEEPGEVVEKFMSHYNKGEFEEAQKYLTYSAAKSFSPPGETGNISEKFAEKVDVKIDGKTLNKDKNRVYLSGTMTVPDLKKFFPVFLEKSLKESREFEKIFVEELDKVSGREISFEKEVVLVGGKGEYKIDKAPFLNIKTPDILGAAGELRRFQEKVVEFYFGENNYAGDRARELVASKIGPQVAAENGAARISVSHPDPGKLSGEFKKAMESEVSPTELFKSGKDKEKYISEKFYGSLQKAIDGVSLDSSEVILELTYDGGWKPENLRGPVSNAVSKLGSPEFKPEPGNPQNPLVLNERNYLWPVAEDLDKLADWEREGRFAFSGRPSPTQAIIHKDKVFYTYFNDGEFFLEGTDINNGEKVFSKVLLRQERFDGAPPEMLMYKGMLVVSYLGGPEGPEFYHPSRGVVAYDPDTMEEVYHVKFDGNGTVSIQGDYIYKIYPGPREVKDFTAEKYSLETGEKIWGTPLNFSEKHIGVRPVVNEELIVYHRLDRRNREGEVLALDKKTGKKLFHQGDARLLGFYGDELTVKSSSGCYIYDTDGGGKETLPWLEEVSSKIALNDEIMMAAQDVFVIDHNNGGITAFDRKNGDILWKKKNIKVSRRNQEKDPLLLEKRNENKVLFVEPGTGEVLKEYDGKIIRGYGDSKMYIYSENIIKQIDCGTGKEQWEYKHGETVDAPLSPLIINEGNREDTLVFKIKNKYAGIDRQTGEKKFQYHISGVDSDGVLAANSDAAVVSNLNYLFMTLSR